MCTKFILFSVFILLNRLEFINARRIELCEDVGERVRESSVLEDYRGRSVILAFSGVHCQGCASKLLRLTEVSRQFNIDVLVITPPSETSETLKRAAKLYPRLRFEGMPCSPCEFDYLLDTNSSKIFVLDSCARLLHRYEPSAEHISHFTSKFPSTHSCGRPCTQSERRKRDPIDLPPVGCGRNNMSSEANGLTIQTTQTTYTTVTQQSSNKNRQYKQIFQQSPPRTSSQQLPPVVPQPVVSVSYNGQSEYTNKFSAAPIQTQPIQRTEQIQQQNSRQNFQQVSSSRKTGTRVQGRYQKYQPDQNRFNVERLEEHRRKLDSEREEHARQLKFQNQSYRPLTQIETPPTTSSKQDDTISFTQAFKTHHRNQNPSEQVPNQPESQPRPILTTQTPRPTPSTTRRPPKTTKNPLVYANQPSTGNFGRRTYGRQPYESTYQMQQRRRNELAAQRQRVIQEKQKQELEQLQRQELQRQIAEQALRQAAAQSAYEQRLNSAKSEAAPLYHDENGEVAETVDLSDYYDDVDEWTTAIPQIRLESPPSPEPLPENPAEHPEFLFDLPCNGFTDEICYQQQTQLEPAEIHKCCQARIVLTDQCVPGRCSNVTNQLCCIQKLLQSKFKCCNDKKQGDVLFAGDSFSRCCYENFVEEEDPCCPYSYSSEQWKSIYELCLPAVNVDLSHVKVPQKVVAGLSTTINFDFSKTDKWRFDCKYGLQVPQYSYFPPENEQKTEEE